MAVFEYSAISPSGELARGVLIAESARHARDRLRSDGLRVQSVKVQTPRSSWALALPAWGNGKVRWAEASHELSMLLAGGVALLAALDTIAAQSKGGFKKSLLAVRERVASGASLAEALAEQPRVFDELSVRLVEVGENAGNLDEALSRLSAFQRRWLTLKDQVTSALIYPLFVLCFSAAATVFLMTYVMPLLLENLRDSIDRLPWPTLVVKSGSDLLRHHALELLAAGAGLICLLMIFLRSTRGRWFVDRMLLKLPVFGALAVKQSLSRTSLILSTLLQSGLPLAVALKLASRTQGNRVLGQALDDAHDALTAGRDLARAIDASGVIPPLAVQIFAVGQESGRLEEMLARLADDYDRQVQSAAGRIASILEPILILLLAATIGFVLLAIVLPILEAANVTL